MSEDFSEHAGECDQEVRSVAEFVEWVAGQELDEGECWFRGVNNSHDPLVPRGLRSDGSVWAVGERIERFRAMARSRSSDLPNPDALHEWLALAQHHGLATNLLDWTRSALSALWFAIEQTPNGRQKSSPASVYLLNPHSLNSDDLSASFGPLPLTKKLVEWSFDPHCSLPKWMRNLYPLDEETPVVLAVVAPEVDPRMLAQQGVFTLHKTADPIEFGPYCHASRCLVPRQFETQIRDELHQLGVSRATLFPDLSNLASYLNGPCSGWTPHQDERRAIESARRTTGQRASANKSKKTEP